jgi:hypothetical protein
MRNKMPRVKRIKVMLGGYLVMERKLISPFGFSVFILAKDPANLIAAKISRKAPPTKPVFLKAPSLYLIRMRPNIMPKRVILN